MKKGKYIDYYIILACLSGKKRKANLKGINKIINEACAGNDNRKEKAETLEPCTADVVSQ